jgi:hypothetical protein
LELSWEKIVLAALALVGTTVLTILVTRFVNWLLDRRSQLAIEVRVNEMFNAEKLGNSLRDSMKTVVKSWEDLEKLPLWSSDVYVKYFASEQYLRILITNCTPKKIAGLTLSIDTSGSVLMQIGSDGDLKKVEGRTPISLGDLQPNRTLMVNVLTCSLVSTSTSEAIQKLIVLSSDEHVRTRYKFPAPAHIEFRDRLRRNAVLIIFWSIFVLILSAGINLFVK